MWMLRLASRSPSSIARLNHLTAICGLFRARQMHPMLVAVVASSCRRPSPYHCNALDDTKPDTNVELTSSAWKRCSAVSACSNQESFRRDNPYGSAQVE